MIATKGPLVLPRDTQVLFDKEAAVLMDRRHRRPDVVITRQFLRIAKRPELGRDIGRYRDTCTLNRREIVASSVARAGQFGVHLRKKPELVR
jgi:hypothetical protein